MMTVHYAISLRLDSDSCSNFSSLIKIVFRFETERERERHHKILDSKKSVVLTLSKAVHPLLGNTLQR